MRAPSENELDELVQVIEDMAVIISHLTWKLFQEAQKDNPHLKLHGRPLTKKEQARMPKLVPTEKTLAMTEEIRSLQEISDTFLDRLKTILRMVDNDRIERAKRQHEKLRPASKNDPMIRDIVQKLDIIYKEVKEERGNDTTILA